MFSDWRGCTSKASSATLSRLTDLTVNGLCRRNKIARMLVIAFAVVVAYPYIPGSSSQAFKGVSILLGVMFSLGSSSVIANLMAGYTMIYRRAFKVGDRISLDNLTGFVTETRLMVTHLRRHQKRGDRRWPILRS